MTDSTVFEHPEHIGPYRVVQVLGEGGMGVVYEAEQKEPVRRRVAVKMMKVGMDTREVVGRFEAERQALAVMDHPGIATVFDAGATEDGRPYFVMELVQGIRIDEYCDQHRLSTGQRVELFVKVCDAVQHAHQKGVIHRDLKPGNILVSEEGDLVLPKIIDFGVAKATGQRLTEKTVVTTYGQAVGTLAYMSPEQAEMSGLDVDTRADVYSLGVILYELLLGVVPFDPMEIGGPVFLAKLIERDTPPPTPTRRLTTLSEERQAIVARFRATDVETLRRELSSDLQWIVLKAIEKERARRYDTATELAADLRRFLDHEPVLAHPPSSVYRLRKFVRRNLAVTGMAAVLAALTLFYAASLVVQLRRVAEERDRAEQEAETAQRVSDLMAEIFAVSDPSEARGRSITALEVLDRGRERIAGGLETEPEVRSRLMSVMGRVYRGLGLYDEAEELLLDAIEAAEVAGTRADPWMVDGLVDLARVYQAEQRYEDALPLVRQALELTSTVQGTESEAYASVLTVLGVVHRGLGAFQDAREALEESLAIRTRLLGPSHEDVGWSLYQLGWLTYREGDVLEARAVYERAIPILEAQLEPDDPWLASPYNDLAVILGDLQEHEEALELKERVLEIRERTLGPDHPDVADALNNLGISMWRQGRYEEALPPLRRALAIREDVFGEAHGLVAGTHTNLGLVLQGAGRYAEALSHYREAVRIHEAASTLDANLAGALNNLGYLLRYVGRMEEARPHLQRSVRLGERYLGPEHIGLNGALSNLGFLEYDTGRYAEAVGYFERVLSILEGTYGTSHPNLAGPLRYLGQALLASGDVRTALQALSRADSVNTAEADPSGQVGASISFARGRALRALGRNEQAERAFEKALEATARDIGPDSQQYADWQMRYAVERGDLDAAVMWLRRLTARGYRHAELLKDPTLSALRQRPEFAELTREIQESIELGGR